MKFFHLAFSGSYLGGKAVVQAGDEQHALETLCNDARFKALSEKERANLRITGVTNSPVVYFDTGDY